MRQSQSFHTTASHSESLHGCLYGGMNSGNGHDEPCHDDMLHVPVETGIGSLLCVESEPHEAISEIFCFGQTAHVNVGDDARLDKLVLHDFPRQGLVVDFARSRGNHRSKTFASNRSTNYYNQTQLVDGCGKFAVNYSLANANSILDASPSPERSEARQTLQRGSVCRAPHHRQVPYEHRRGNRR